MTPHIETAQKLLPCGSSKLCFEAQKILFVPQNKLAPNLKLGDLGLPPKSAIMVE